jgi:transposase
LKVTKGANRAKVATARRLLTIAFMLLRDGRSYQRRGATPRGEENLSRLS